MLSLLAFKEVFDERFGRVLTDYTERVSHRAWWYLKVMSYLDHANHIALWGGKRLRPYLAYCAHYAYGGNQALSIDVGIGLEMIHALALMLDDIADGASTRHHHQTLHTKLLDQGIAKEQAYIQTALVSDFYYHRVFSHLMTICEMYPSFPLAYVQREFHTLLDEVLLGEMIDIDMQWRLDATIDHIRLKDHLKTSSYTCIRPLLIGALAAKPQISQKDRDHMYALWCALGAAYQIADDLGDLTWLHKDKPVWSDIQEWQQNMITVKVLELWSSRLQSMRSRLLGQKDVVHHEYRKLYEQLKEEHILHAVYEEGITYLDDVEMHLHQLDRPDAVRARMMELVGLIKKRMHI